MYDGEGQKKEPDCVMIFWKETGKLSALKQIKQFLTEIGSNENSSS